MNSILFYSIRSYVSNIGVVLGKSLMISERALRMRTENNSKKKEYGLMDTKETNAKETGFKDSLKGEQTFPPKLFTVNAKKEFKPMKVIDMTDKASAKAYLTGRVDDSHTKEELEAIHRSIRYTQLFKQEESYAKMDEEESIERLLPKL
jgi:hypothetical protein